jgi:hypothetical protein
MKFLAVRGDEAEPKVNLTLPLSMVMTIRLFYPNGDSEIIPIIALDILVKICIITSD